jgi:hypothetical protein
LNQNKEDGPLSSSFRDPSGFLFRHEGKLYRQVNSCYRNEYDHFLSSGLYDSLVLKGLLIPHSTASLSLAPCPPAYKILEPEPIPFISYPYEWCFGQLKHAAMTTLSIQQESLKHGMSLKDASAYNIQFHRGKPIHIDTLSFERFQEGRPWVAYRQFCQHFLAPLALMAYTDVRLNQLLRVYLDGIPLDQTAKLLPAWTRLKFSLLSHIFLHARAQRRLSSSSLPLDSMVMSRNALLGLLDNLMATVSSIKLRSRSSYWSAYYEATQNYSSVSFEHKKQLVCTFLEKCRPSQLWDLGSNTGVFSLLSAERNINTIAFDTDHLCVEHLYDNILHDSISNLLPLVLDLSNPSPNLGWNCSERDSLPNRGPADTVMALALIHHLAISNNLPFQHIAHFMSDICRMLIIEFVPKHDSQSQTLLRHRRDAFDDYTLEVFESHFRDYFDILAAERIQESDRILYLMANKR